MSERAASALRTAGRRVILAMTTIPPARRWQEAAAALAVFAAAGISFGLATGVLRLAYPADSVLTLLAYAAVALLFPALAEELVFRALLLPHPSERVSTRRRTASAAVAGALFVLWHPLEGWLLIPWARALFSTPAFLVLAGLLGVCLTITYLRSGSIWPCVVSHWIVVVAWKLAFGGRVITFGAPR